jgi:hypothetical protein
MVNDFNHPFEKEFVVEAGKAGYTTEIGPLLALMNVWLNAGGLMKLVMSYADT